LKYESMVAIADGRVAGFAVCRRLAEDESELLNLAVDPDMRRRGIGRRLVSACVNGRPGELWLEVRESNLAARRFYSKLGFTECGKRADYYPLANETAIVMKFHS
jgi:[ribosomal protein S18]-alanine N-acetyltransferase